MAGFVKGLPNERSIRIGKNIKTLREIKGLTQADLGAVLNLSDKSISLYEVGKRIPNKSYLKALAVKFDVTVEMLENDVITRESLHDSTAISWECFDDIFNKSFIRLQSKAALKNEDFIRATEFFERLWNSNDYSINMLKACRNRYYKAFKEANIVAAAANTLMMLYFEFSITGVPEAQIDGLSNNTISQREFADYIKENKDKYKSARNNFVLQTEDIYDECLLALRNSADTKEVSEFYMALRYQIGMVENDDEEVYAAAILSGFYMFWEYTKLGNKYCERFFNTIIDEFESVESFIKSVE